MNSWPISPQRRAVLARVAAAVPVSTTAPVLLAVDGVDGAGKSVFADELSRVLVTTRRPVIRASVDDFHRPRADRYRRGRSSPIGFWLDAFDYDRLRTALLDPLLPGGSRSYRTAVHDVAADQPVHQPVQRCPEGAVLVLDGLFLHRDELRGYWDLSIWLEVPFSVTAARMARRDGTSPDPNAPSMARYIDGQRLYLSKCQPSRRADVVIDNTDPESPYLVRPGPCASPI